MIRIAVLVSGKGRGSNMQALIEACRQGRIQGEVVIVLGTRSEAPAIERARSLDVPVEIIHPRDYPTDEAYGEAILQVLHARQVDLICLAGYMRLLPSVVVQAYAGRLMNIHPALLPLFGGQGMYGERVHQAVLESGMKVAGCTVHFVDEQYDTGPIILQTPVLVEEDDTPETLAARILPHEHETYIRAVQLYAEGRLRIEGRRVRILPAS